MLLIKTGINEKGHMHLEFVLRVAAWNLRGRWSTDVTGTHLAR